MEEGKEQLCVFKKILMGEFSSYCKKNELELNAKNFLCFLCAHNIIQKKTVERFLIIKQFKKFYPQNDYHKTRTVYQLADYFNVHENTIWNVLKHHAFDFEERSSDDHILKDLFENEFPF